MSNGKTVERARLGWGVMCQWPNEKPCLCGIYYWAWATGNPNPAPVYLDGCRTAVFKTRKIAREHCLMIKTARNHARVVRVAVTVECTL